MANNHLEKTGNETAAIIVANGVVRKHFKRLHASIEKDVKVKNFKDVLIATKLPEEKPAVDGKPKGKSLAFQVDSSTKIKAASSENKAENEKKRKLNEGHARHGQLSEALKKLPNYGLDMYHHIKSDRFGNDQKHIFSWTHDPEATTDTHVSVAKQGKNWHANLSYGNYKNEHSIKSVHENPHAALQNVVEKHRKMMG